MQSSSKDTDELSKTESLTSTPRKTKISNHITYPSQKNPDIIFTEDLEDKLKFLEATFANMAAYIESIKSKKSKIDDKNLKNPENEINIINTPKKLEQTKIAESGENKRKKVEEVINLYGERGKDTRNLPEITFTSEDEFLRKNNNFGAENYLKSRVINTNKLDNENLIEGNKDSYLASKNSHFNDSSINLYNSDEQLFQPVKLRNTCEAVMTKIEEVDSLKNSSLNLSGNISNKFMSESVDNLEGKKTELESSDRDL